MRVHHFDPATGVLLSSTPARLDPLETEAAFSRGATEPVYLVPDHATLIAPPAEGENQVAVFDGKVWRLEPDHRGEFWFRDDGAPVTIVSPGDPVAAGLARERPRRWGDVRDAAWRALQSSDLIVLRCYEAGVAVPQDWRAYRRDLRAIIRAECGDPYLALPRRPDKPSDI